MRLGVPGGESIWTSVGEDTGALKEEIRRYLRAVDLVLSAEDEHVEQGGAGITVVRLDV